MRSSLPIKSLTGLSAMFVAAAMTVPAHAYEEGAVAGGGSITGKVVFNGTPGTRKVIPTKDLDVCGGPYEETLIQVGPDKSVYNAVVYLADIAKGKAWPAQAKPPEIDNVKCKFEPHIQVSARASWTSSTATRCSTTHTAITASALRSTWLCRTRASASPSS